MPAYWSKKDERQYQHIKESCMARKRGTGRTAADCNRIAASTVNKQRRKEGRTLSEGPVERTMRQRAETARKCEAYMREENRVCANPVGLGLGGLGIFAAGVAVASWMKKGGSSVSGCSTC